ncbi:MAG: macro domain-containing protein [Spirochaetia bacterium]|nr:macro domain-containing protein [Spirochaetia bacterium]
MGEYKIIKGDVTEQNTEAIVNAANTHLVLGAGVAGAIRKKGGHKIQKECDTLSPVKLGDVALTSAGEMSNKYILHAATMHPGGKSSVSIIERAVKNVFNACRENNIKSVSLPAIGCGIAGVSIEDGAKAIMKVIKEEIAESNIPEEFRLVLFSNHDYQIFLEAEKN